MPNCSKDSSQNALKSYVPGSPQRGKTIHLFAHKIVNEDEHYSMRIEGDLDLDKVLETVWISESEKNEIKQ